MKVSIITLHNVKNYGSALQTFATQYKFEKIGCEVEFVNYYRKDLVDENMLINALKLSAKWNVNLVRRVIYKTIKFPTIRTQQKVFNGFLKRKIHLTDKKYYSLRELKNIPPNADVYCTGSDQTWNSGWNQGILGEYFLEYAPDNAKCISYSASFGKSELDDDEVEQTRKYLEKYSAISVREASGVNILNSLGLKNGFQILDPTLVLSKNEWECMVDPKLIKGKYVLIYQLNSNPKFDSYVERFAKEKGIKVVNISLAYNHIKRHRKTIYIPSVEQWLSLFYYAEYIITDSFHGTAFSINFNKKFLSIYPEKFSSRIQSILDLTGLTDRHLMNFDDFSVADRQINYKRVNDILDKEREKVNVFLKKVLAQEMTGEDNEYIR